MTGLFNGRAVRRSFNDFKGLAVNYPVTASCGIKSLSARV